MRSFNSIIFVIFFLIYGTFCVFQFLSGSVFEGVFASRENSVQMYLYIAVFITTIIGILPHSAKLKGQDSMFYLVIVYMLYYVVVTVFYLLLTHIDDIKYIGTGVIMSSVSPLVFLFFYHCAKESDISLRKCVIGFSILLFIDTCATLRLYNFSFEYSNWVVIMQFYTLFFILPWMLCIRKRFVNIAIFFVFALLTAYSAKRGAFLTLLGSIMIFYMLKSYIKNKNLASVLLYPVIIIPPVLCLIFCFIDFSFMMEKMESISIDRGSGRLDIYQLIFDTYKNSGFMMQFFGNGGYYGAKDITMQVEIHGAHNDFLQVLLDIGIPGLIILFSMIYILVKRFFTLVKSSSFIAPAYGTTLVMILVLSNVSTVFCGNFTTIPIWAFWGYIIGAMNANNYNNFLMYPPQDTNFLWKR